MWVEVGLFGIADDDDLGRRGDLLEHRVQVVLVRVVQRHSDLSRSRERSHVGVNRERGPCEQDLVAVLAEGLRGGEQELAAPVGDSDRGGVGVVALGDPAAEKRRARIGIAVHRARGTLDRSNDVGVRSPRRLVRGELGDVLGGDCLRRLAGGNAGLVAGNLVQAFGGANRHCAECRSARSFFVSPR